MVDSLRLVLVDGLQERSPWSYESIRMNLHVDPSTVHRMVKLFLNTGMVYKMYIVGNLLRKLNDPITLQLLLDCPSVMLREIQAEVKEVQIWLNQQYV